MEAGDQGPHLVVLDGNSDGAMLGGRGAAEVKVLHQTRKT